MLPARLDYPPGVTTRIKLGQFQQSLFRSVPPQWLPKIAVGVPNIWAAIAAVVVGIVVVPGTWSGHIKPGHAGGGAARTRKRPGMSADLYQQSRRAGRAAFSKLAIVASIIAGAALASACSQPSDTQQAQQQQQGADEQARKDADEKAWADAEKAGTAAAYTAYIQNFGGGAHVAEARQRVGELSRKEADDKAWAGAVRAGTAAALTAYTQNFSSGAHVAEARQRLATLDEQARKDADDKAWADADKAGTAAAFNGYIQKFGSGAHVAEARQRIAALDEQARKEADEKAWADAEKAGTAAAFTGYVQKFGSGAHVAEARKRAAALETQGRKEVPTIDIQKTCQAAAGAMLSLMGGTTTEQDVNACLDSEQKARDQIVKDLATYSSADKKQCMRTDVYLPSYVEWLTCLEMERDVRKMQQEERFGAGPWTLPKVRSAINEGRTVSAGVLEARANDSAQRASKPARAGTRLAAPRRRAARRGSGGPYAPARLTPPSLPLAQQSTGVYIPPPVSNPSAQINQLNQSFQFNRGLGNNPTDRDSFIRYNLTR